MWKKISKTDKQCSKSPFTKKKIVMRLSLIWIKTRLNLLLNVLLLNITLFIAYINNAATCFGPLFGPSSGIKIHI
jgi:hypothetical protein